MTNAAIKQDFWKEKLSATLHVQDTFGTASFNHIKDGPGFYDTIHMRRESQVICLSPGFRINNHRKQNAQREEGSDAGNGMEDSGY